MIRPPKINSVLRVLIGVAICPGYLLLQGSEVSYTYDGANRLIQVAYPQGSGIRFNYDVNDNLTLVETISLPPAPSIFSVISQQPHTAQLQWNLSGGVSGYAILRRSADNRVWQELTRVPANSNGFLDTTLLPDKDYVYQLFAIGPGGALSAGSRPVSPVRFTEAEIPIQASAPAAYQNLLRISIGSHEGIAYRIEGTSGFTPASWSPAAFSMSPAGQPTTSAVWGTGGELVLYLPHAFSGPNRFYRIVIVP